MKRSIWALAAVACAELGSPARAGDTLFRIDIPAGDLTDALATLSSQTGVSVGLGTYPGGTRSGAVRGRFSVPDALARMLGPTPFRAERMGPSVWRLVRRRSPPVVVGAPMAPIPDIVVTARKLPETLSRIATPVAVFVPENSVSGGASDSIHDVAAAIEGLSVTNLGLGRERPFIRGMADSPFNGFSQSTVSINIDDARVTYDAPEPGLRLVDIARVEVLKGPQGPLYGTGALGGVYRVVTNKPVPGAFDSTATSSFAAIADGGFGAEASLMANVPVSRGRAAIRIVAYGGTRSGWVRDTAGLSRLNDSYFVGARGALRVVPASGWTVDVAATRQRISLRDSQYVVRDVEDLQRYARSPEPASSTFSLANGTVAGPVGTLRLTVSTSHAWQNRSETYDVGPSASVLGYPAGRTYQDRRRHKVFDQEVRLASTDGRRFAWTAGASYLGARTFATGTLWTADGAGLPFSFVLHRAVTEAALFADGSREILPRVRAGLGARVFRATTDDERSEELGVAATARASVGVTPSGSLTYALAPDRTVYLRFGTAFRPGGLDPSNAATGRYDSDEVRSIDIGTRLQFDGGRLSLTGGGFRSYWSDIQSDYLLADGLVATRNAGGAVILGAEGSAQWRLGAWALRAGATVQRARLETAADGSDLPNDRRLPTVPDLTGRIDVRRTIRLADLQADVTVGGSYTGSSRLSFDEGLDREMGEYALFHASALTTIGGLDLRVSATNLLNTRADSFSFGNPFRVRTERQYTPLQPRTVTLALSRRF